MEQLNTIIIGAGQAGLATSYYLKENQQDHIILEKDRIGEAWRSAKWDSFTLVTPNWMCRLPGFEYNGNNPDGFLTRDEVVRFLVDYADEFELPVRTGVEVHSVVPGSNGGYSIETSQGKYSAGNVVVATGTFQQPKVPGFGAKLSSKIKQYHSSEYRNPADLPSGAVLIVGSAQSGCQIADELNENGREVYLSTGKAGRLPRQYRGKDSFWWAREIGLFDQTVQDLPSPNARFAPNPQVSGKDGGKTLGLHRLAAEGVTLLGRMQDVNGTKCHFNDDLHENLASGDEFEKQFKQGVDQLIEKRNMELPEDNSKPLSTGYDQDIITALELQESGITNVIWATGYKFDYSWIKLPLLDEAGYPRQERGVTDHRGLYFVGLNWLHTRKSGLLWGVGDDAAHVVDHLVSS